MLRHVSFRLLPRLTPSASPAAASALHRRSIFTDEFLRIDSFRTHRKQAQLLTQDAAEFKSRLVDSYDESRLKNIFREDLTKFLLLTNTVEEAQFLSELLRKANREEKRLPFDMDFITNTFLKLCKTMEWVEPARELIHDPDLADYVQKPSKVLLYLMTLYSGGEYQEVLQEVERNKDLLGINFLTVGAAAAHQLGTNEALDTVSTLLKGMDIKGEGPRAFALIAHLAHLCGENGYAYDLLLNADNSIPAVNVKLAVLVDSGRIEDAVILLKKTMDRKRSPLIIFETIRKMVDATRTKYEAGSPQVAELTEVCEMLDETANVSELTLSNWLLSPIGISPSRDSLTSRRRRDRDGEDDDDDDVERRRPSKRTTRRRRNEDEHEDDRF